jgi:polysaccharide chain length determinant protein (PEP-CTERM system associated)
MSIFAISIYIIPEKYEARSSVFIEENVISNYVEGVAITPSMDERLSVLSYSIKSRNLILKVIEALDLDIDTPNPHIENVIKVLQDKTKIEIIGGKRNRSPQDMDLFIISLKHKNPKFAMDYVNTLVNLYIKENLLDKRQESHVANKFLSEQIAFFKNKLNDIDKNIVYFRTEKGIFVSMNEEKIVKEIEDAEKTLEELKINKMELQVKKELITKDLKKENPYTVTVLGSENSIEDRIVNLQNKLDAMLMNYTEKYPEVLGIISEIETLKKKLKNGNDVNHNSDYSVSEMSTLNPVYQELKKELSKTEVDLASLETRENYFKKLIEAKKTYMKEIPVEKKKLADLEREKSSYMKIYDELVLRFGQSEVSKQMEIQDKWATFRIVDRAVLPTIPVSPNRVKIILLGILAGFASAFGLVLLTDSTDPSVKAVDKLKRMKVPVLAIIPKIQTLEQVSRKRRKDITTYTIAGVYLLCILGVFVRELFNKILG